MADPVLHIRPADGPTTSVVLVLHGGKVTSTAAVTRSSLVVLRMVPFARAVHRALGQTGTAVWSLRYAARGWNGSLASPVADARWALQRIRDEHGEIPVVLLGHSMGGRTSLRVADDPNVVGVVALAPWLPQDEPITSVTGKRVVIIHGLRDRWVPAAGSRAWAQRARKVAADLQRIELRWTGHSMLRRAGTWHSLAVTHVADMLDRSRTADPPATKVDATTRDI